jgi:hypothetical protein
MGAQPPPRPKPLLEYPYRYQELPPNDDDVRIVRRRLSRRDLIWY